MRTYIPFAGLLFCLVLDSSFSDAFIANDGLPKCMRSQIRPMETTTSLLGMKRPILDQLATFLFRLENSRVEKSSVVDENGRSGEPMEWSESDSLANRLSTVMAGNSLGYRFKQFVADIVAGDNYDVEAVNARIDNLVSDHPVVMFSFSTCPFCRRAKDFLDEKGVKYEVLELDELEGNAGNEIRANLGRKTGRTSVPSIFIGGNYIGGCNDGPGLLPLDKSGELDVLLQEAL
jgi:glutaredoxin 3